MQPMLALGKGVKKLQCNTMERRETGPRAWLPHVHSCQTVKHFQTMFLMWYIIAGMGNI